MLPAPGVRIRHLSPSRTPVEDASIRGVFKLATQGKVVNIALKSFDLAALPRNGETPKIS
jgi:hypothetical protein